MRIRQLDVVNPLDGVTFKDIGNMRRLLDSIEFLEDYDEPIKNTSSEVYGKWQVINSNIILEMRVDCSIRVYVVGGYNHKCKPGQPPIRLPQYVTIEKLLSDESLDKKSRTRLAWIIGSIKNV